jgi:hypothetical protein
MSRLNVAAEWRKGGIPGDPEFAQFHSRCCQRPRKKLLLSLDAALFINTTFIYQGSLGHNHDEHQ